MYNIGDKLTLSQYNGIISILRHFTTHKETITITDKVNGEYGDYEFKLTGSTILDTGIVISDETLLSQPRIRLTNPLFTNSQYTLHLTILHYAGVNVLDDVTGDYTVVEELSLPLTVNEWVNIPVESLDTDYIISLDATVEISHDLTEVIENQTYLTLSSDKDILSSYDHEIATITAKLSSETETVAGQTVTFTAYHDDALVADLGSAVTDGNGECSVTYSATGIGEVEIVAECRFVSETYSITDAKFKDIGTITDYNDMWYKQSGDGSLVRGNDCTTITETTPTLFYRLLTRFNIEADDGCVEFDYRQIDGDLTNTFMYIRNSGGGVTLGSILPLQSLNKRLDEWVHIKCAFDGTNTFKMYVDGGEPISRPLSTTYDQYNVMWSCNGSITEIQFKNFVIY